MRENNEPESPMKRFEDLAKRLFSKSKDEVQQIEREGEVLADEPIEPPKPMPDE